MKGFNLNGEVRGPTNGQKYEDFPDIGNLAGGAGMPGRGLKMVKSLLGGGRPMKAVGSPEIPENLLLLMPGLINKPP